MRRPPNKKVPDDLRVLLIDYGTLGSWKEVSKKYGCSVSTIKNAMQPYMAGLGYHSVGHAIWQEFVEPQLEFRG